MEASSLWHCGVQRDRALRRGTGTAPRWFAVPPSPEMDIQMLQQANRSITPHDCDAITMAFTAGQQTHI